MSTRNGNGNRRLSWHTASTELERSLLAARRELVRLTEAIGRQQQTMLTDGIDADALRTCARAVRVLRVREKWTRAVKVALEKEKGR